MQTCGSSKGTSRTLQSTRKGISSLQQLLQRPACCRQHRLLVVARASAADHQGDDARRSLRKLSSIDIEKEDSRRYRRTTYNFDDWKNHRSTTRYWRHIRSGFVQSRIVKGLAAPLTYVAILSAAVCFYESALAAQSLPKWGFQWPSVSMNSSGPFGLSTFALSLLLVFRTNSSYQRWAEARRMWGLLINRSRDLARQVTQWFPQTSDSALTAAACRWIMAFPIVLMASLRDDVQMRPLLEPLLLPHELEMLMKQPHPGTAALQVLGSLVKHSGANRNEKLRIDENITVLQDVMGVCERIFRTPIPLSYTRHTSRFLVCWMTCLPFCVADSMGWTTVPIAVGLAFFLFGIEEIGVQIEEPFGILALEVFCANIIRNIRQAESVAAAAEQYALDQDILSITSPHRSASVALETIGPAAEVIGSSKYDVMEPSGRYMIHSNVYLSDSHPAALTTGGPLAPGAKSSHQALGEAPDTVQGNGVEVGVATVGSHSVLQRDADSKARLVDSLGLQAQERHAEWSADGIPGISNVNNNAGGNNASMKQGSNDVHLAGNSIPTTTHSSHSNSVPRDCGHTSPSYDLTPKPSTPDVRPQNRQVHNRDHQAGCNTKSHKPTSHRASIKPDPTDAESSYELRGADSGDDVYLGMSIGAAAANVTSDESQEPGL